MGKKCFNSPLLIIYEIYLAKYLQLQDKGKIFKIGVELNKTKEELDEYKQLLQNNAAISQKLHDRVDDLNKENIKLRGDTSLLNMKSELKVKDNQI